MLEAVKARILENASFLVVPHEDPDGDTLGSATGLSQALKSLGKSVQIFLPKPPSPMYLWMADLYQEFAVDALEKIKPHQVIIVVDCGSTQLIKASAPLLKEGSVINIDHHGDNGRYGQINWVDGSYASTTMMIYDLIRSLQVPLTSPIVVPLYAGLVTDTGNFAFSNTNSRVFEMAAQCASFGVTPYEIYSRLFESRPINSLKLLGLALSRIETNPQKNIGWISVGKEMLKEAGALPSETDGIINYLRTIDSLQVALVFRENENGKIKVSLRSKSGIDVNRIAKEFGGGGHPKAAGCTLENSSLDEAVEKVIAAVQKELD